MNLEPNKLPLGRVRKVVTTTSLLPPQIQPSYSSTYLTKEKLLETLKKQAHHQNNFDQGNQTNRSNNLNSKSKSSSRMPSREHSQVKLKNSESHNNNLREKNSSNIHQKVKELKDSKQKGFFASSTSTSQAKRRESNENKNLNQMTKPVANLLMNSQKPPKKLEKINPLTKLANKNKTIEVNKHFSLTFFCFFFVVLLRILQLLPKSKRKKLAASSKCYVTKLPS